MRSCNIALHVGAASAAMAGDRELQSVSQCWSGSAAATMWRVDRCGSQRAYRAQTVGPRCGSLVAVTHADIRPIAVSSVAFDMWDAVTAAVEAQGVRIDPASRQRVSGGSINEAWRVDSDNGALFVKLNDAGRYDMFVAEAEGLSELAQADAVRVPDVICSGAGSERSFLVLEFIALQSGSSTAARRLGTGLAQLHAYRGKAFGWHRDNTIGSTPQINTATADWVAFFGRWRLGYQLDLARRAGAGRLADLGAKLCEKLPRFFAGVTIEPALLHGDLWGGNWGSCDDQPVIFDPAVYYGDPESDIAMTTLFGGFPREFYDAYRAGRPDQPGGSQRRELYRLYHVLNHYNLFGGGYAAQAEQNDPLPADHVKRLRDSS